MESTRYGDARHAVYGILLVRRPEDPPSLSDTFARLVDVAAHDPLRVVEVVWRSVGRNIAAEAWFYGMIVGAFVFGVAMDVARHRSLSKRYMARGIRVDLIYGLLELGHVVQLLVIIPTTVFFTWAFRNYAPWATINTPDFLPGWAQLVVLFLVSDFVVYWWHRLQHESIVVWQFHKTHHSQQQLNVFTTFRVTIIDRLIALPAVTIPAAIMQVDATMPLMLVAILLLHQLLIHSDTGMHFGPLERLFVSPSFHEVHHSSCEPHLDKNYGGVLAIWDHLFRTFAPRGDEPIRYGLVSETVPESYFRQQFVPLIGLWKLAHSPVGSRVTRVCQAPLRQTKAHRFRNSRKRWFQF